MGTSKLACPCREPAVGVSPVGGQSESAPELASKTCTIACYQEKLETRQGEGAQMVLLEAYREDAGTTLRH